MTALVTGVSGQDGAYLSRLLTQKGYRVVGVHRPSTQNFWRLHELGVGGIELVAADLTDPGQAADLIHRHRPDEVYSLGAQAMVNLSFADPFGALAANALSPVALLQGIRDHAPQARFVQASTCTQFGDASPAPQDETTPFGPSSPYGASKAAAHAMVVSMRAAFGLHASCAVLYNHISPLTDPAIAAQKVVQGLVRWVHDGAPPLRLGYLDAGRDWGDASEYVDAMWRMAQLPAAQDLVIGSGQPRTLRELIGVAAQTLDLRLEWTGAGLEERAIDAKTGRTVIEIDAAFYRPTEAANLVANPRRAREVLGWSASTPFIELIERMVARAAGVQ